MMTGRQNESSYWIIVTVSDEFRQPIEAFADRIPNRPLKKVFLTKNDIQSFLNVEIIGLHSELTTIVSDSPRDPELSSAVYGTMLIVSEDDVKKIMKSRRNALRRTVTDASMAVRLTLAEKAIGSIDTHITASGLMAIRAMTEEPTLPIRSATDSEGRSRFMVLPFITVYEYPNSQPAPEGDSALAHLDQILQPIPNSTPGLTGEDYWEILGGMIRKTIEEAYGRDPERFMLRRAIFIEVPMMEYERVAHLPRYVLYNQDRYPAKVCWLTPEDYRPGNDQQ